MITIPYKSEAQRKFFHANVNKIGKATVEHWDKETKGEKIPKKAPKKK